MKDINLDAVQEAQEFERLGPGGYICGIVRAEDVPEKEYLRIEFDIADGPFKNYFRSMRERLALDSWPASGVLYRSYKESALPFFKQFVTCVQVSNAGYVFKNDEATLARKLFGVVMGEEEYEKNDGTVGVRLKASAVRSVKAIREGDFKVPAIKKLKTAPAAYADAYRTQPANSTDYAVIDDGEDLPF